MNERNDICNVCSSIKEDVEEEEDYEEEDGEEDERDVSNHQEGEDEDKKESQPVGGYCLLEGQEDEREAPDACSSCSSDLSFGGSSSGSFFCYSLKSNLKKISLYRSVLSMLNRRRKL